MVSTERTRRWANHVCSKSTVLPPSVTRPNRVYVALIMSRPAPVNAMIDDGRPREPLRCHVLARSESEHTSLDDPPGL